MKAKTAMRVACALIALVMTAPAGAQEEWVYSFAPYGWVAGIDGETTAGGVTIPAEADFGEIVENLESGFFGHFEAARGHWTVIGNLIFLGIGQTTEGIPRIDIDVDELILELGGGYELSETFEVLFGGRYVDIDVEADFSGPLAIRVAGDKSWVDPFVGGRFQSDLGEKWWLNFRGDIGGFGVGSDFAWDVAGHLVYRLKENTGLAFGYRILDIDYEDGEGLGRFAFDVETSGPQIGIEFRF